MHLLYALARKSSFSKAQGFMKPAPVFFFFWPATTLYYSGSNCLNSHGQLLVSLMVLYALSKTGYIYILCFIFIVTIPPARHLSANWLSDCTVVCGLS